MARLGSLVLLMLVALSVAPNTSAQSITVAGAADLNYALNDLAGQFERATGNKVVLTVGASGNLYSQIVNGAPFDLFFSADEEFPKRLVASGIADASSLHMYAMGHLVLWVPNSSPFDPDKLQMGLLTRAGGEANRDCQSAARSVRTRGDGSAGALWVENESRGQTGFGRERQSGRSVCSVGQRAGGTDCAVAGEVSSDGITREVLGIATRIPIPN